MGSDTPKTRLGKVIQIDEGQLKDQLGALVRESVEDTLNGMLDAEADRLCQAKRYEHNPDRGVDQSRHPEQPQEQEHDRGQQANAEAEMRLQELVGGRDLELHDEGDQKPTHDQADQGERGDGTRYHHRAILDHFTGGGQVGKRTEQRGEK